MAGFQRGFSIVAAVCMAADPVPLKITKEMAVWQGFRHKWENKALGLIQTPHRMGSVANAIKPTFGNCSEAGGKTLACNLDALEGFVELTPGVDGDFAHPEIHSSFVRVLDSLPGKASFGSATWTLSAPARDATTWGEKHKHPDSKLRISSGPITFDITGYSSAVPMLGGFKIDMKCVKEEGSLEGTKCNSNGIWPYYFHLEVEECQIERGKTFLCRLSICVQVSENRFT